MSIKGGRRHSKEDHKRIRAAREAAKQIDTIMAELGDDEWDEEDGVKRYGQAIKAVSYEQLAIQVHDAVMRELMQSDQWGHVVDTYPTYAVVEMGSLYWRANYSRDARGAPLVDPIETWQQVERDWIAPGTKSLLEQRASLPRAVKATGAYTVRGLGLVYGGKDLYGDTFETTTDYGADRSFVGMPVYYDHALGSVKSQIGTVKAYEFTDDGIEFEIEIDRRKRYADVVMRLAESGALGQSTGAPAHLVHAEDGTMKRWIISEVSLTPTPAEPRTSAAPTPETRTLSEAAPQEPGEGSADAAQHDTDSPIIIL